MVDDLMQMSERFVWMVNEFEKGNRAAMARKLELSGQAVINICDGAMPSGETLIAALQAYPRVSPDWLLLGREPRLRITIERSDKERAFDHIAAIVDTTRSP